ncbi:MAG: EAL domain-containing protein [Planctomycetales bacterium]|nr:EAL domain-containing protein [Planctomycetales bacterium]
MRIWHKLLLGLLLIGSLLALVATVSIAHSLQVNHLGTVELPMEQNLREVEVSIWQAIHAANAFRSTGDPFYANLYAQELDDADENFSRYAALTDTDTERLFADEFNWHWRQAKSVGSILLRSTQREAAAGTAFSSLMEQADEIIDRRLQAQMSPSDPQVLAKEQTLREVEVGLWETLHAAAQYSTLTGSAASRLAMSPPLGTPLQRQFATVEKFWSQFKSLATSPAEIAAIDEFEQVWRQAREAADGVIHEHELAAQLFEDLFQHVDAADDVIDFNMQEYIQKRIRDRGRSASIGRNLTLATAALGFLGVIVIYLTIARSIAGPVKSLMTAVDAFGAGNLDYRIASQRNDELGDLSHALDCMGEELKRSLLQISREVTERQQAEGAAREAREFLETALAQSPSGILIARAPDQTIQLANQAALDMCGWERCLHSADNGERRADRWEMRHPDGRLCPREKLPLTRAVLQGEIVRDEEYIVRDHLGRNHWISANAAPLREADGQVTAGILVFHDVTERKQMMEQMQEMAFHDSLTGLPNRTSILQVIQKAVDRADGRCFALLYLDFDRFKLINDSLGHEVGDELLQAIAHRIRGTFRAGDGNVFPGRLGGDEFVVFLDDLASVDHATLIAERLLDALSQSYQLRGQTVYSTASIGVVTSDHQIESANDMLRDADLAMYQSKAEGRARYAVFDQVLRDKVQGRLRLENEMRQGIARDEFVLAYQPIICLETGRVNGAEALARWMHPQHGAMGAEGFIHVAEETGLIVPLGEKIIHEACRQLAKWQHAVHATSQPLCIHLNISRLQLLLPDLIPVVEQALKLYDIPPQCLLFEVTETIIMDDPDKVIPRLMQLRQMGVKIAIDDFGTGYSTLVCLRECPIDLLKIDRTFVGNIKETPEVAALLTAVLTLAEQLDLKVVAEGIEEREQLAMLRTLGCQYGQGYLFANPMSATEMERYIGSTLTMIPSGLGTALPRLSGPPLVQPDKPTV